MLSDTNLFSPRRALLSGTAATAILLGSFGPVSAADSLDDSLGGLAPVTSDELSANRGGFNVGPVNISLGFTLSTSVSGGSLGAGVTVTTNFSVSAPGNLANLGTTIRQAVNENLEQAGVPHIGEQVAGAVAASLAATLPAAGAALNPNAAAGANSVPDVGALAASIENSVAPPANDAGATGSAGSFTAPGTDSIATPPNGASAPEPTPLIAASIPSPNTNTNNVIDTSTAANTTGTGAPAGPSLLANNLPPAPSASQFNAQIDSAGNVAFSAGGTNVFLQALQGQLALIQNTENNVQIKNNLSANYVIENYQDIAQLSALHQQLSNLASQMLALQGLGRH